MEFKRAEFKPLQVEVTSSFEDAFRKFKSLVQKERVISDYKERMEYEKPSVKKRRKAREALSRKFVQEMREKMIKSGEWERVKRRKEKKKEEKLAKKIRQQEDLG